MAEKEEIFNDDREEDEMFAGHGDAMRNTQNGFNKGGFNKGKSYATGGLDPDDDSGEDEEVDDDDEDDEEAGLEEEDDDEGSDHNF